MKNNIVIYLVISAGIFSGIFMTITKPMHLSIGWADLAFVFAGCSLGLIFVLGIQVLAGNHDAVRFFWNFFAMATAFLFGDGLAVLAISILQAKYPPESLLFLVATAGLATGLWVIHAIL